jgi:hypothetical protein
MAYFKSLSRHFPVWNEETTKLHETLFCIELSSSPRIKLVNVPHKSTNHSTMTFSNSDLENQYSAAIGNSGKKY